jgi:hypothetical protein
MKVPMYSINKFVNKLQLIFQSLDIGTDPAGYVPKTSSKALDEFFVYIEKHIKNVLPERA